MRLARENSLQIQSYRVIASSRLPYLLLSFRILHRVYVLFLTCLITCPF